VGDRLNWAGRIFPRNFPARRTSQESFAEQVLAPASAGPQPAQEDRLHPLHIPLELPVDEVVTRRELVVVGRLEQALEVARRRGGTRFHSPGPNWPDDFPSFGQQKRRQKGGSRITARTQIYLILDFGGLFTFASRADDGASGPRHWFDMGSTPGRAFGPPR